MRLFIFFLRDPACHILGQPNYFNELPYVRETCQESAGMVVKFVTQVRLLDAWVRQ